MRCSVGAHAPAWGEEGGDYTSLSPSEWAAVWRGCASAWGHCSPSQSYGLWDPKPTRAGGEVVGAVLGHHSLKGGGSGLLRLTTRLCWVKDLPSPSPVAVAVPTHRGAEHSSMCHMPRYGLPQGAAPHRGQGGAAGAEAAESAGELCLEHHCPEGERGTLRSCPPHCSPAGVQGRGTSTEGMLQKGRLVVLHDEPVPSTSLWLRGMAMHWRWHRGTQHTWPHPLMSSPPGRARLTFSSTPRRRRWTTSGRSTMLGSPVASAGTVWPHQSPPGCVHRWSPSLRRKEAAMRHRADPSPGLRQPPQSSHCCRNRDWRDRVTAGDGNGQGAEGLQWGQHSHLPACRHCRELGGASLLSAPSVFPGLFHLLPEWVLCCGVGRLRCWHPAVCMHPQPAVPPPL